MSVSCWEFIGRKFFFINIVNRVAMTRVMPTCNWKSRSLTSISMAGVFSVVPDQQLRGYHHSPQLLELISL